MLIGKHIVRKSERKRKEGGRKEEKKEGKEGKRRLHVKFKKP